ncbi:MAG TPA: signal protein, partial [Myxococcales bacterium]|nr:signal protein [Myxococcales bacterium]
MEAQAQAQASNPRGGRRIYVVDRRFQLKYTLLLVGVGVSVAALFGVLMYLLHLSALRAYVEGRGTSGAGSTMFWAMLALAVTLAASLSLVGVMITHRVAGPVHVMNHYLNVLAGGRYPILRPLRKGDELQRFFETFQGAVESLRTREAEEADTLRDAVAALS